jgi:hypothetical protein
MNNDLQYYLKYIISWFYFNVLNTDASYAILRILIIIGLVSLLVYQEYILFILLCIVVICVEMLIRDNNPANTIRDIFSIDLGTASKYRREVAKDELTTGVSLSSREGFSLGLPKIITGDDSGKDHRRPNKFIEEHSREFTDKYFSSKQCSIGSGVGEITMFGSNEIIGNQREASFNRIYNFGMLTGGTGGTKATNAVVVFTYLKDCVYNPIKRNDFRDFKTTIFKGINENIIKINACLDIFITTFLFSSTLNERFSRTTNPAGSSSPIGPIMLSEIINTTSNAGTKDHEILEAKLSRINTGLSTGVHGIVFDNEKYTTLVQKTNNSKDSNIIKQRKLDIYGKVYGFRQRIDTILKVMRDQVKNDFSNVNTVSVSESIVNELRTMLSYLAIIQQSNTIIVYERGDGTTTKLGTKIYDIVNNAVNDVKGGVTDAKTTLLTAVKDLTGLDGNIFDIPLEDDTYNTNDEKRYLYGITHFVRTT